MGIDQGEENEQDGSERFNAGGAATTTAGALRLCNKQIQPRPLKRKSVTHDVWNYEAFKRVRRMH